MHAWARHMHAGAHRPHIESAVQQIFPQGVVTRWSSALASTVDSSPHLQVAGRANSVEGNAILIEEHAHSPSGCILVVPPKVA
eukprot:366128-Chlamydomonas_euryale.AAC.7